MTDQYIQSNLPAFNWFLVHCKPNSEQIALLNIENQEVRAFLPMQKLTRRKGNTFKMHLRPLFPGYLFVYMNLQAGHWRKINNTRGVARIVQLGINPCPVPNTVVAALLERCDADHVLQDPGALEVGNQAHISEGPLSGFVAEIIAIEPDSRVHLLLDIMGQATHITVAPSIIVPAR